MIEPEAPQEERTTTQVSGTPGQWQETSYRSQGPVATAGGRLGQLVWLAGGVVAVILALDFVFKLVAANSIGFVGLIANLGGSLSAPFRGILSTTITPGAHVTYWPDLAAIVVYAVAAWIVVSLIKIVATPSRKGTRPA
jgi:hypothetical protein